VSAIYLLPLGNVDHTLVQSLCSPLGNTFHTPIQTLNVDVDLEQFYDDRRCQYNSTAILRYLRQEPSPLSATGSSRVDPAARKLAILAHDLFIPILTYVFGEAELGGRVAVISYHRLMNERYGLPPNQSLLIERVRKEALHELGHAYGLLHCSSQLCVMHTSTYVEDIDLKGSELCPVCIAELTGKNSPA
jgi:archaemetzincin